MRSSSTLGIVEESHDSPSVPLLEPGDRLTRVEFERRYDAMPGLKKAELIEGTVYMAAAVRLHRHGSPDIRLGTWLGHYEAATPGVIAAGNTSVRIDTDNMPQPDALLLIDPACGGQARISADDYVELGPELVAEISSSSVSFDLHTKLNVYRRSGVREYLVWRVVDRALDWVRSPRRRVHSARSRRGWNHPQPRLSRLVAGSKGAARRADAPGPQRAGPGNRDARARGVRAVAGRGELMLPAPALRILLLPESNPISHALMTSSAQMAVVLLVVAVAVAVLVRRAVRLLAGQGKSAGGCGSACGGCSSGSNNGLAPVLVPLGTTPQTEGRRPSHDAHP
jgi:Uma2 family endonuclease